MAAIEIKHSYSLPVETVFGAFTDLQKFENFLFRSEGGSLVKAELNPEVGGQFTVIEKRGEVQAPHYGTFLEFEPNEKISFVFAVGENTEQTNYVELFFNTRSSGSEITVKTDIEVPEMVEKSKLGWTKILGSLDMQLSKGNAAAAGKLVTKDSQGNILDNDDVVRTIKDLNVKGSSMVVKRGTIVKRLRLINGNNEEIDCKVDGVALRLETQWLLKS